MNTCPHCHTANPNDRDVCGHCQRPLPLPAQLPPASSSSLLPRGLQPWTSFSLADRLVIGRDRSCGVCLPHPSVSRQHALLERRGKEVWLRDLDSANGVFLNNQQIVDPVPLAKEQLIGIGPYLLFLAGRTLHCLDSNWSLRLDARGLEKEVRDSSGQKRQLLHDINVAIEPGQFVCLLGPSGSGKSTLMDCLNGRRLATGASKLLANGQDFYQHFATFRQSLGYVPQKDIVHTQLTVHGALRYTAQLRLPADMDQAEIDERIESVIEQMELTDRRDVPIARLSGGQIKRVSLGAELLGNPCLLYIDEATSGLDPASEQRMMVLFRTLTSQQNPGTQRRSIICITHSIDNLNLCDRLLILSRGRQVFYGPPPRALEFFQKQHVVEIYDQLAPEGADAAEQENIAREWEARFRQDPAYKEFVAQPLERAPQLPPFDEETELLTDLPAGPTAPAESPDRAVDPRTAVARRQPFGQQLRVLTQRHLELLWCDRASLLILLLQAPMVALFMLLGFAHQPYEQLFDPQLDEVQKQVLTGVREAANAPPLTKEQREVLKGVKWPANDGQREITAADVVDDIQNPKFAGKLDDLQKIQGKIDPSFTYKLLFVLAIIVLWLGCNNAAREIVKEEAIYGRERAINLGIAPYLGSKFLVLCVISAVQVLLLMVVIFGVLHALGWLLHQEVPPAVYRLNYPAQYGVLVLLAWAGVALGLLLSAWVRTPDQANTLLPYVLIPQIILGGALLSAEQEPVRLLSWVLSPVYWAYRAIHLGAHDLPKSDAYVSYSDSLWLPCGALILQIVVLLLATAVCLKRKDLERG